MRKLLITGVLLSTALFLFGAGQVSAYEQVTSGGCLNCHTFANGSGAQHTFHTGNSVSCTECHVGGSYTEGSVDSIACRECHFPDATDKCDLVNLTSHDAASPACISCHSSCDTPTTTTTIPVDNCTDEDGDGYYLEDGCLPKDCDDTDSDLTDNCTTPEPDCEIEVSVIRKLSFLIWPVPIRIITIESSGDEILSADDPLCITNDAIVPIGIREARSGSIKVQVLVRPLMLERGDYAVSLGSCTGTLTVK